MRPANVLAALIVLLTITAVIGCGGGPDAESADCATIDAANADHCIRLNEIQILGTHNSYRMRPEPALYELIEAANPQLASGLDYGHVPIREQLDRLHVRQFEFDVFADSAGGLYDNPYGRRMIGGGEAPDPVMSQPGFKVLHIQDIDYRSNCPTLVECLTRMKAWMQENPRHLPIMVLIEVKDQVRPDTLGIRFVRPIPIGTAELRKLESEIRIVFSETQIITPDDVRGDYETLEEAVRESGWPTLAASRGKILFALDNTDAHRDAYLDGSPNLERRLMFVSSPPGEPSAAFIKMNDPLGGDGERIREWVRDGFLVRTRADIPTLQARSGDTERREAAFSSGAQYVSTDYPLPSPFESGYLVRLPSAEDLPGRCNPVSGAEECRHEFLTED